MRLTFRFSLLGLLGWYDTVRGVGEVEILQSSERRPQFRLHRLQEPTLAAGEPPQQQPRPRPQPPQPLHQPSLAVTVSRSGESVLAILLLLLLLLLLGAADKDLPGHLLLPVGHHHHLGLSLGPLTLAAEDGDVVVVDEAV